MDNFKQKYWRYYLMLENKFIKTLEYVEPSTSNLNTYSNEYAHLIQAIGAELDCFFKFYCGHASTDRFYIKDYATFILQDWSEITTQVVKIAEGEIASIKPFEGWNLSQPAQSLAWWYAFDKIKHSRVENMQEASLKNTLNILAGLYMLEKKYIQKIALKENSPDVMRNDSEIFILEDWTYRFESTKDLLLEKQGNELIIDANSAVQQAQ